MFGEININFNRFMYYNFCTLFDKGYLNRGLALYNSVLENCSEPFRFFILPLDDVAYDILDRMKLKNVILIKMADFEDEGLLKIKKERTYREYVWGLSSCLTAYVFNKFSNLDLETLAYIDSDMFFYSPIKQIYNEFGDDSVMIFKHNLPEGKKEIEDRVGKYNVGMVLFRNDKNGRDCLEWWHQSCREWCYEIAEPTRYADQKYLDYFEEKFSGVCVSENKGANLAGWCIKNYKGKITEKNNNTFIDGDKLVFFHFSGFSIYYPPSLILPNGPQTAYNFFYPSIVKKLIYNKYIKAVYKAMKQIRTIEPNFAMGMSPRPSFSAQLKEFIFPVGIQMAKNFIKSILKSFA